MVDGVDVAVGLETIIEFRTIEVEAGRVEEGIDAETGLATFSLFAGDSALSGNVDVEALVVSCSGVREMLEALEMESSSLWNLRFVVLKAVGGIFNLLFDLSFVRHRLLKFEGNEIAAVGSARPWNTRDVTRDQRDDKFGVAA